MTEPLDKVALRSAALARFARESIPAEAHAALQLRLNGLPELQRAQRVALYAPLTGEPAVDSIWAALAGRALCAPGHAEAGPELRSARSLLDLVRTRRGFAEPPPGPAVAPASVDCFIVPGLAFDDEGYRLGRGGGYYDRLLAQRAPEAAVVGVSFERFLVPWLPRHSHDVPMTILVTELRTLRLARGP